MLALITEANMDSVMIYKGIQSSDISNIYLALHFDSITHVSGNVINTVRVCF